MKPFIEAQRELLQKADKALELCQRKLRIAREIENSNPLLSLKTAGQAERHMNEYHEAKAELLASWESEEKVMPDKTNMAIAEDFEWYPHDHVN